MITSPLLMDQIKKLIRDPEIRNQDLTKILSEHENLEEIHSELMTMLDDTENEISQHISDNALTFLEALKSIRTLQSQIASLVEQSERLDYKIKNLKTEISDSYTQFDNSIQDQEIIIDAMAHLDKINELLKKQQLIKACLDQSEFAKGEELIDEVLDQIKNYGHVESLKQFNKEISDMKVALEKMKRASTVEIR